MANKSTTQWVLKLVDEMTKPIKEVTKSVSQLETTIESVDSSVKATSKSITNSFNDTNKSLKMIALQAGSEALQNLGQPFIDGADGTYKFNSSLKELEAITGVSGSVLEQIGENARQTAKDLGGDASESLNSYTVLLSKLTPEIAKSPEALARMGKSVGLLGETMKGDLVGATNSASSVMNQFGVDLSDPIAAADEMDKMLNQLVASAKVGSQEVPAVAEAIDQVGAVAKNANVSFAETNAALQVLGKFGKEGAEGGIALRNVLAILSKQEFLPKEVREQLSKAGVDINKLSDKTKPLSERLSELKKLSGDDALLGAMFGMENTVAITGLLGNLDLLGQYTNDIQKDQTALNDMASKMGESYEEQKDRIKSYFDDLKLSIYGATGELLPFIDVGLSGLMDMINLAPGINATVEIFKSLSKSTRLQTAAQWLLNIAMNANPIGLIILGIAALIALVVVIIKKYDEWGASLTLIMGPFGMLINLIQSFRRHWDSIVEAFKSEGIIGGLKRIGLVILDALLMPIQQLLQLIAKIPGMKGIAGGAADWIQKQRESLNLVTEKKPEASKKKETVNDKVKPQPFTPGGNTGTDNNNNKSIDPLSVGSGSGGIKNITMTLNVTNNFAVAQGNNLRDIADKITTEINDRLRDGVIAIG